MENHSYLRTIKSTTFFLLNEFYFYLFIGGTDFRNKNSFKKNSTYSASSSITQTKKGGKTYNNVLLPITKLMKK